MPLFQENPVRSAIAATAAVGIGHLATWFLVSPGSSQLLQSLIAVAAIGALVALIVVQHRQEGRVLTQTQEEAALIGGLALLWIVIVVSWRALSGGGSSAGSGLGSSYGRKGYGSMFDDCPPGDAYCHVVEEWY
ncbi:hypothetical protein FA15DRAFT_664754 [Coprinopsis marcescibilis]|uniref:Uncharacterized protein n=1 Tax=Coprinopsis marcescibilis TaxID=230819 RepID=A0A5C3L7J2_COPMA|nr:hypothetical protein FA15DRAFT_664754 [Coprinopsis marcescibilis]